MTLFIIKRVSSLFFRFLLEKGRVMGLFEYILFYIKKNLPLLYKIFQFYLNLIRGDLNIHHFNFLILYSIYINNIDQF